jgi:hypothetical protein
MSIIRPTSYGLWASGASGNVAEPIAADKAQGFLPTGIARSSYANWLWGVAGQWNQLVGEVFQPQPPTTTQDLPQLSLRGPSGPSGASRWAVDHLGLPISPNINVMREDWTTVYQPGGSTLYVGVIPPAPRWAMSGTGGGVGALIAAQIGYPLPAFDLSNGASAGARLQFNSTQALIATSASGTIAVLSADVGPHGSVAGPGTHVFGVANIGIFGASAIGVFTGTSGIAAAGYAWFRRPAGATAWLAEVATGSSAVTSVNTGRQSRDLAAAGGAQNLRLELCAPDSPYGAVSRFLIDGSLVATGPLFQRQGCIVAAVRQDGVGFGDDLIVGTLEFGINKKS